MKRLVALLLAMLFTLSLTACGGDESEAPTNTPTSLSSQTHLSSQREIASQIPAISSAPAVSSADTQPTNSAVDSTPSASTKKPTDITTLTPSKPDEDTPNAPETLHVTQGGEYSLTGVKRDVMITVDAGEEEVTLTLAGVEITNTKGPALYVASAKKVNLILAEGTNNILSDGTSYSLTDGTATLDAALFSRSDLHLSGGGSLQITGNYKHGLVSKDDLKISGGTYQITAKNVALEGKDSVKISGGTFSLTAGSDGIRATNTQREDKGFVEILGGTFTVTAGNDSVQASTNITLSGGNLTLYAGQSGFQAQGSYLQTAGAVTAFGTLGSGKALLNAKTAAVIKGGTFFGFGDGTKAKHFTTVNGGCALLIPFSHQSANTPFTLTQGGKEAVTLTPPVGYSMALIYTPALTTGECTLTLGSKTHTFAVTQPLFILE